MSRATKKRRKRAGRAAGDGWHCHYCHKYMGKKTRHRKGSVDHVIPLALGGPDASWNLVFACQRCNSAKSDMTYEEFTGRAELPPHSLARTTSSFLAMEVEW